ncbi:MAG: cation:proton antiporter [Pseudanabaenaceae cyanobacterium]
MTVLTLIWIAFPFLVGFIIYLLPKSDRYLGLVTALASGLYTIPLFLKSEAVNLRLLDHFGVSLLVDPLTGFFILTNALVTAAVVIYCWRSDRTAFFYAQVVILHGSVNAAFACSDFISLYVALEVISIATFLLIAYPRSDRSIWIGLRYLFTSNVAMLFYLIGAVLVYKAHHSFDFSGLRDSPPEAIALIFLGLLAKGGIFVSGLWLPLTHAESESPVSAMMSGVVVKAGVLPLVRCALLLEEIALIVRIFGVTTALLGVAFAVFEKDTKRMLAFHTISQLGFILAAPEVGGFYALTHGLVKSSLFLIVGNLPSRSLKELKHQPITNQLWGTLVIASFSISGFPLLSGFGAKVLTMKNLLPWQGIGMNIAALGTSISFAKFIFLPHGNLLEKQREEHNSLSPQGSKVQLKTEFWVAMAILLGGLVVANVVYYEAYSLENIGKPLITIGIGWVAYFLIFRHTSIKLPVAFEDFENLIGCMVLMLIVLFWMAIS